jgi:hypothetical protein
MTAIVRLDKSFSYRGQPERWSNKYHLTGGNPGSTAEWDQILAALTTAEKAVYDSTTTIVYASCYTSDTGAAVYTKDYTLSTPIPGTLGVGGVKMAGDQSAWVRWWAGRYNTRGKLIYLRKYFHGGQITTGGGDTLQSSYKTALTTFANLMISGLTITGYSGRSLADKNGNAAQTTSVPSYVTTRTLKRRSNSPL